MFFQCSWVVWRIQFFLLSLYSLKERSQSSQRASIFYLYKRVVWYITFYSRAHNFYFYYLKKLWYDTTEIRKSLCTSDIDIKSATGMQKLPDYFKTTCLCTTGSTEKRYALKGRPTETLTSDLLLYTSFHFLSWSEGCQAKDYICMGGIASWTVKKKLGKL